MGGGLSPAGAECRVWWASTELLRPWHRTLLTEADVRRHDALRRAEDRRRFVLSRALERLALAAYLGLSPGAVALDRTCPHCGEPHGKPRLADREVDLELSVTHAGDRAGLAIAHGPVGIDVEPLTGNANALAAAGLALAADEIERLQTAREEEREPAFLTTWTRKEAVLKATGEGLTVAPTDFTVSPPGEPPAIVSWPAHPELADGFTLMALAPGPGYVASLAVLGNGAVALTERTATPLLTGGG